LKEFNEPLPHSDESERNVLGAIIIDPSLIESLRTELSPDRFFSPTHQKIFATMLDLRERDEDISPVAIHTILKAEAPISLLTNLTVGATSAGIKQDVTRIVSMARRRWIARLADRLYSRVMEGDETEDRILAYAANQIDSARIKLPHQARVRFLSEMVDSQAERYQLWHKGISNALPTGFDLIDNKLLGGGLVPSGLYVLAARPSMGKTALCLDIAANIAQEGKTVHIVSREMPAESLFDRLHAANVGIARWKLRAGIYQSEYLKLIATLPNLGELPIALDNLSLTASDIRANFRELERKHRRPDLLIVDYIQLVEAQGRSRNDEVGSVTRALKGIAMEFQIPVLALSQLSRDCEKQRREPELSDLRDSGEIEQDADAAFFLFGEKPEESASIFSRWFKCAKQRDGELFRAEMTFNGELVTFRSFEQLAVAGVHDYTGATT
jgi:replicative DNA helicase